MAIDSDLLPKKQISNLNQRVRFMMVTMTQISCALSSLRENIKDTGQPAKQCFTNNLCFLCHFRNNFESLVDRVTTVLHFSILS